MGEPLRIALLMGLDVAYCRGVLRGIHAFCSGKVHWMFRDGPPDERVLAPLLEWKPDGVIVHLNDRALVEPMQRLRVPVVNTTNTFPDVDLPLVEVDHRQVGRLAASHFLDRKFTHFGFFGSNGTAFSRQREEGFRQAVAEAGGEVSSCHADFLPRPLVASSWKDVDRRVGEWLASLPKPAAVFATEDVTARQLSYTCRQLGYDVPDDVAILGVDNDELECMLASPPLSTVINPSERIGYRAAELLDHLLRGGARPREAIRVPADRILARQSTDTVAVPDSDVAAAVAYLRRHIGDGIGVIEVVRAVGLSRRKLERKFRAVLGRTVLEELQKARVEAAKRLLVDTDLLMPLVARRAGFSTTGRLTVVFRQHTGTTPTNYRRHWQVGT